MVESLPKLIPCTFCGEPEKLKQFDKLTPGGLFLFVLCEKCFCEVSFLHWQHPIMNVLQAQSCIVCACTKGASADV